MAKQLIAQYYNDVNKTRRAGETHEGALSMHFFQLLFAYAKASNCQFSAQPLLKSPKTGKNIRPDGALMNELRIHRGYWESKDLDDNLDFEIDKKINTDGYPNDNILFEDSQTAVLIQHGQEVMRCDINKPDELHKLITAFIQYKPNDVLEFEKALEAFKRDIPQIAKTFRELFEHADKENPKYIEHRNRFLELCKIEINPDITEADVREMLIQHILTGDLFTMIFNDADFLRENVIAKELEGLINTVLTRTVRQNQLNEVRYYYQTLNATAARISDHNEKQKFLKVVYENFYKVYNPKGADRLGVVYTPNEIVRFMVESTDYLLDKHFGKNIYDEGVQILDPATGTGTFITDIIDFIPPQFLEHKYKNELHANEVSILPYYIANLNIEYVYKNKMGKYIPFENICFVDTLDNIEALNYAGKQTSFMGFSSENALRIKNQNMQPISVIIGNPPYNANQQNENDNNKNREYFFDSKKKTGGIDGRIKETYIKQSSAQKTKVYDMYARFYRWAMDRIGKKGVIAFITNRSFIDSRTFDGFRKCIQTEFDYAFIIDTKSDVRANPKIAGSSHNIFGIQTGVAVMFLVRKEEIVDKNCRIEYTFLPDEMLKEDKLSFFKSSKLNGQIFFKRVSPDEAYNWVHIAEKSDWDNLLQICDKSKNKVKTIFEFSTLGVSTNRDNWVYDFSENNLTKKMDYFVTTYTSLLSNSLPEFHDKIKWSRDLKRKFAAKKQIVLDLTLLIKANYRPYTNMYWYGEKALNDILTQNHYDIFGSNLLKSNKLIGFLAGDRLNFAAIATNLIPNLATFSLDPARYIPLYRYSADGERVDNITDWGAEQVRKHYGDASISKEEIFEYVYAVLHNPAYRKKYELNLKREFPRLPFYADFRKWAAWGKELMRLHIGYESAEPFALQRSESDKPKDSPRPKLKADKEAGIIFIDENTQLAGIPAEAWRYMLGNRSALEWVLDQYKESKISDPTVAELFDNYRFADYKEQVIDLLARLCTVSVRSVEIESQMNDCSQ